MQPQIGFTRDEERTFTNAFDRLVSTGMLRQTVEQLIPILRYHAHETVYRAGCANDRVFDNQFASLPTGELFKINVYVQLLDEVG